MLLPRLEKILPKPGLRTIRKAGSMKEKRLMIIAGLMSAMCIIGCMGQEGEVQFARRVLHGLCSGKQKVESSIAWERFRVMGVDVGTAYTKLASAKEKADYRKAFFYNLSYTFKASKGRLSDFTNWQVKDRGIDTANVSADTYSGKVLLMTLSYTGGRQKLIAMSWQQ